MKGSDRKEGTGITYGGIKTHVEEPRPDEGPRPIAMEQKMR